jgi:hypothetical protein
MKKANVFWVLAAMLFVFYSCVNDKSGNTKLLTKLIETSENGSSVTTLFTYNGNEIVRAENGKEQLNYTYTNGLISKIVTKNKSDQSIITVDYKYENEKLITVKSSDNYWINFVHNTDGTVVYERFTLNAKNQEVKLFHGIISFKDGNLIKDKRILDDTAVGVVTTKNLSFEYDSKKNPMHSILGFDKLVNQNQLMSINNSVISVVENSTTNALDQIISSARLYKSTFEYDTDDYPSVQINENTIGNTGYLKSEYYY